MVEQLTLNQWAQGSSPWKCTKKNTRKSCPDLRVFLFGLPFGREQADGVGMYFAAFKISELRSRYFSVRSVISRPKSRPSGRLASKRTCGCSPRFPLRISLRNLLRGPLKSAGKKQSSGLFLRPRVPGLGACYRRPSICVATFHRSPSGGFLFVLLFFLGYVFGVLPPPRRPYPSQTCSDSARRDSRANQYATGILVLTPSSRSAPKRTPVSRVPTCGCSFLACLPDENRPMVSENKDNAE